MCAEKDSLRVEAKEAIEPEREICLRDFADTGIITPSPAKPSLENRGVGSVFDIQFSLGSRETEGAEVLAEERRFCANGAGEQAGREEEYDPRLDDDKPEPELKGRGGRGLAAGHSESISEYIEFVAQALAARSGVEDIRDGRYLGFSRPSGSVSSLAEVRARGDDRRVRDVAGRRVLKRGVSSAGIALGKEREDELEERGSEPI